MLENRKPDPDRNELRQFGLTTGILVAVLFGILFPWLLSAQSPYWPWCIAIVLVFWALIAPSSLDLPYKVWMRFGLLMNRITTPLLLGIVFYLIITPMGLVMKLFGRDMIQLESDYSKLTYRQQSRQRSKKSMEKPF